MEYVESKTGYKNSMGVNVEYRTWFNDNFESKNFFVPSMPKIKEKYQFLVQDFYLL